MIVEVNDFISSAEALILSLLVSSLSYILVSGKYYRYYDNRAIKINYIKMLVL